MTVRITEAELTRDIHAVLAKVQAGAEVIVEQDHRAIKRRTRPMLGFKDFRCARILLSGIELMHMISKGQMKDGGGQTPAQLFYSLAK